MDTVLAEDVTRARKQAKPSSDGHERPAPHVLSAAEGLLARSNANSSGAALAAIDGMRAAANMNRQFLDASYDLLRYQQDVAFDTISQVLRAWTEPTRGSMQAFVRRSYEAVEEFTQTVRESREALIQQCMPKPQAREQARQDSRSPVGQDKQP